MHNPAWPGWVKIGCVFGTELHVERILQSRLSGYNVADPFNGYEFSLSSYAACARTAEDFAHNLVSVNHRRGKGEWWYCSLEEARRLVEKACEVARLRPSRRRSLFEEALEKERSRMKLSDTHKIMTQMIAEDAATKTPKTADVSETARAARAVIETLLEQMAMPDENTEAAARAVLRRLDVLEAA